MKKKQQIILLVVLVVILVGLIAAFFGYSYYEEKKKAEDDTQTSQLPLKEEVPASDVETPEEVTPTGPASFLTGLPLADASKQTRRPLACMIENTKVALPHAGINTAGIVYECPMEGGLTRYMGIFDSYDGLTQIGNVRSCRPYFAYIAAEYDGIYAHYGQSVQGKQVLDSGLVDDLNGLDGSIEKTTFFRTKDRKAPHNAWTSADGVTAGIEKKGYRKDVDASYQGHFTFAAAENALPGGSDCKALSLYYSNNKPYFKYDDATKTYKRFEFGAEEKDAVDGQQIAVSNIIVQEVPVSPYDGYEYLNIPLTGSGSGKFITDGRMVDITWSKDSEKDRTHYFMPDGSEIQLNPGKTFVELVDRAKAGQNAYYQTADQLQ